jgi:hypothetical protein
MQTVGQDLPTGLYWPPTALNSNGAIAEGALSVLGRRQAKGTSEITHGVALTLVAYHGHDLLSAPSLLAGGIRRN